MEQTRNIKVGKVKTLDFHNPATLTWLTRAQRDFIKRRKNSPHQVVTFLQEQGIPIFDEVRHSKTKHPTVTKPLGTKDAAKVLELAPMGTIARKMNGWRVTLIFGVTPEGLRFVELKTSSGGSMPFLDWVVRAIRVDDMKDDFFALGCTVACELVVEFEPGNEVGHEKVQGGVTLAMRDKFHLLGLNVRLYPFDLLHLGGLNGRDLRYKDNLLALRYMFSGQEGLFSEVETVPYVVEGGGIALEGYPELECSSAADLIAAVDEIWPGCEGGVLRVDPQDVDMAGVTRFQLSTTSGRYLDTFAAKLKTEFLFNAMVNCGKVVLKVGGAMQPCGHAGEVTMKTLGKDSYHQVYFVAGLRSTWASETKVIATKAVEKGKVQPYDQAEHAGLISDLKEVCGGVPHFVQVKAMQKRLEDLRAAHGRQ